MAFLRNLPQGFAGAAEQIAHFPAEYVEKMTNDVCGFVQYKINTISAKRYAHDLAVLGIEVAEDHVQSAINAILFIIRGALKEKVGAKELNQALQVQSGLSGDITKIIARVWHEHADEMLENPLVARTLSVGTVVDVKWKLGVALASSACDNLNQAYVAVVFTIADSDGKLTYPSFELSIAEFQAFAKSLHDIGNVMDAL